MLHISYICTRCTRQVYIVYVLSRYIQQILYISRHPWNLVGDHSGASTSLYPRSLGKPFRAASQAGQQPQNDTPSMVVIERSWCLIRPAISWVMGMGWHQRGALRFPCNKINNKQNKPTKNNRPQFEEPKMMKHI